MRRRALGAGSFLEDRDFGDGMMRIEPKRSPSDCESEGDKISMLAKETTDRSSQSR
jgi:hypothetical protein